MADQQEMWEKLEALRLITEATGVLHQLQERQLQLWPRAAFFQSTKSTFRWDPGEKMEELTAQRVDRTIANLKKAGVPVNEPPRGRAKCPAGKREWKRRPELRFDIVLNKKLKEPKGLEDRISMLVKSLRHVVGAPARIVLAFSDGTTRSFEGE